MNNSVTVLDSIGILDFPATIEIDADERGQGQRTLYTLQTLLSFHLYRITSIPTLLY
jgi:hypothetical protein